MARCICSVFKPAGLLAGQYDYLLLIWRGAAAGAVLQADVEGLQLAACADDWTECCNGALQARHGHIGCQQHVPQAGAACRQVPLQRQHLCA